MLVLLIDCPSQNHVALFLGYYILNSNFLNLEDLKSYFGARVRSLKASRVHGQAIACSTIEALDLHQRSKEEGKKSSAEGDDLTG